MNRSLSIIIPAFNEERRLPPTLEKIAAYLAARQWTSAEILVVNDGSSDRTAALARAAGARVVENPGNRGKGYSVRHGVMKAEGEWLLFTDSDLSTPMEELDKLYRMAEREHAEVAIGSRALDRSLVGVHQPPAREFAGRVFNVVMRAVTGLPFRDTQCGFKLFQREAAREIFRRQRLDGFGFDVEALFIATRLGCRVLEIPVRWNDVAGTKVSATRGLAAFLDLLQVRWNALRGYYR